MKTFTENELSQFTRDMFLKLSPDEVIEYWKQRNRLLRDQGKPHQTELLDGKTFQVVATI